MPQCPVLKVLAGLMVAAGCALSQSAVSARPGTVNYVEGHAYVDGQEINQSQIGHLNLDVDQTLRTDSNSKAEILLTPGVFLRIGNDSQVRMVTPSLTDTRIAVTRGEALVNVAQLFKENHIEILNSDSSTTLLKTGLYRFNADPPTVAVIDGKALVRGGDSHTEIGKGREVPITPGKLKANKFDRKVTDDLYAWSNLRSEYAAEASYASAKDIYANNYNGWTNGWMWNPYYSSWAFIPGNSFLYDPFGWGFYSPRYIGYAPIYYIPGTGRAVPLNPRRPPIVPGRFHGWPAGRTGGGAVAQPPPRVGLGQHAAPHTRATPVFRSGFGGPGAGGAVRDGAVRGGPRGR